MSPNPPSPWNFFERYGRRVLVLLVLVVVGLGLAAGPRSIQSQSPGAFALALFLAALLVVVVLLGPIVAERARLGGQFLEHDRLSWPRPSGLVLVVLSTVLLRGDSCVPVLFTDGACDGSHSAIALALLQAIGVGTLEELLFRLLLLSGFVAIASVLQGSRSRVLTIATAVAATSFLFGPAHFWIGTDIPTVGTWLKYILGGGLLALVYLRAGLFAAIATHALANFWINTF